MQQTVYPRNSQMRTDSRQFNRQRPRGNRPVASVNLGRLADAMGPDVLATCLGISEPVLLKIVQGQDTANDYQAHIEVRFKDAGVPSAWLNQTNANINPKFVDALMRLAAGSTNKAPTRRHNFQTLVDAFGGRIDAVAKSLDMAEASIRGITDGRLLLDDERVNHVNPRLMQAGFPDGWLDEAQATVEPTWVPALEALVDAEEEEYEAQRLRESADRERARAERISVQVEAQSIVPTESKNEPAVQMSLVDDLPNDPTDVANLPSVAVKPVPLSPELDSASMPVAEPTPSPAISPALAAQPPVPVITQEKPAMPSTLKPSQPNFKPGNFAGAGMPSTPKLPRGAMGAGRSVGIAPKSQDAASPAAPASATKAPKPSRVHMLPAGPGAGSAPTQVANQAVSQSTSTQSEPADLRNGKSTVSKEVSHSRAVALEKLLTDSRRGAKVTLWRDLLGSSLPFWGNVRRGTVLFRDDLAERITEHLGLPAGWLDNPVFPPQSLADWVTNPEVPLPTGGTAVAKRPVGRPPKAATPAGTAARPVGRPPKAAATEPVAQARPVGRPPKVAPAPSAPAIAPPAADAAAPVSARRPYTRRAAPTSVVQTSTIAPTAPPVREKAATTVAAPAPTVQLSPAAHAATSASSALVGSASGIFQWSPAAQPQQLSAPGPLVQALNMILNQVSLDGRFTDDDALRLIAMLTGTR